MGLPIYSEEFWAERLVNAKSMGEIHRSVYHCSLGQWEEIEKNHRKILADYIKPSDSILDAGCGYGRLLTLLPESWQGKYLGVDLSSDFVKQAKELHPDRLFAVCNMTDTKLDRLSFDWAICISIRQMILSNRGEEDWQAISRELHRVAKRVLILEYDAKDKGEIEL
jgi:ubiquinone/menaquinone biosynthesis C-methylase UbiE